MQVGSANGGKLGKRCSCAGCGVWSRGPFGKGQQCFKCKSVLYQGNPKDNYPGQHHSAGGKKATAAPVIARPPRPQGAWVKDTDNKPLQEALARIAQLEEKAATSSIEVEIEEPKHSDKLTEAKRMLGLAQFRLRQAQKEGKQKWEALCNEEIQEKEVEIKELQKEIDQAKPVDQLFKEATNAAKQAKQELDKRAKELQEATENRKAAEAAEQEKQQRVDEQQARHRIAEERAQVAASKAASGGQGQPAVASTEQILARIGGASTVEQQQSIEAAVNALNLLTKAIQEDNEAKARQTAEEARAKCKPSAEADKNKDENMEVEEGEHAAEIMEFKKASAAASAAAAEAAKELYEKNYLDKLEKGLNEDEDAFAKRRKTIQERAGQPYSRRPPAQ